MDARRADLDVRRYDPVLLRNDIGRLVQIEVVGLKAGSQSVRPGAARTGDWRISGHPRPGMGSPGKLRAQAFDRYSRP